MRYATLKEVDKLEYVIEAKFNYDILKHDLSKLQTHKGNMSEFIRASYLKIAWMQDRFNALETKSLIKYSHDSSFDKNERKIMKKVINLRPDRKIK